jgi:Cdc6-like AAA superfamily ATPase
MLKISETKGDLEVKNVKNNLDKLLAPDIPYPLPPYSGFSMLIVGSSGSGKTTLLYNMVTGSKKKGKRTSYKKVFDFIYIISPTLGGKSMKNDKFSTIPEDQIYRELTLEGLTQLEETLYKNREDDKNSLVILDDVGSQLKRNAKAEKKLTQMLQNRRHVFTSYITLLQKFKDAQTGYRSNLSHAIFFRPKNRIESDAISNELLPFDNKKNKQIIDYVFDNEKAKYPFLMIDMSLKLSNRYLFFSGFNPLLLEDEVE